MNVPMGDMIREMAMAIADAQMRLDENSIEVAEMMGGLRTIYNDEGEVSFEDSRVFFGRESITIGSAVQLHNNTTDDDLKLALAKNFEENYNALVTKPGGDYSVATSVNPNTQIAIPTRMSMLELGFTPTFYQFVDNIIEVKIAISMTRDYETEVEVNSNSKTTSSSIGFGFRRGFRRSTTVTTTQVNATYSSKYNYSAEGSSLLRTKLTPIPPPAILEERIRLNMDLLRQERDRVQAEADKD